MVFNVRDIGVNFFYKMALEIATLANSLTPTLQSTSSGEKGSHYRHSGRHDRHKRATSNPHIKVGVPYTSYGKEYSYWSNSHWLWPL